MTENILTHEYEIGESPKVVLNDLNVGSASWIEDWRLDEGDLTWRRPYEFITPTGKQLTQEHIVAVRPGVLSNIERLDGLLTVLYSDPMTPDALPDDMEGVWLETNPYFPGGTLYEVLGNVGLRPIWEKTSELLEDLEHIKIGTKTLGALKVYAGPRP